MARAWLAKPEGLLCKIHINISSKQYNTCELRFSARPGEEASELELTPRLPTITVVLLTLTWIFPFRRNSSLRSGGNSQRRSAGRKEPFQGLLELAPDLLPSRMILTI